MGFDCPCTKCTKRTKCTWPLNIGRKRQWDKGYEVANCVFRNVCCHWTLELHSVQAEKVCVWVISWVGEYFRVFYLHIVLSPEEASRLWVFRNSIFFYGEELLAPRPTPKLEDHHLSAVRDCLFNLFVATLPIGGRSCIRNLKTRHAVVTGTHTHGLTGVWN